ncbi:esterase family protein [Actinoplanes sp. KI2]|uniref:alpha/beta hydrolase n=1 Tax=Actinoplanes sp. KI2 TaxID=2983315 RepID=UPI0021D57932|nr:esterase family protein [Actinoplanes sp. KI2]MCU7727423.1 esterase family protein [Actinoplanes sp. KI2]
MSIDGLGTILAGVCVALAVTGALALLWDRIRIIGRSTLIAAMVLSIAATAGLELNRLTETYPTWAALADDKAYADPGPTPVATPSSHTRVDAEMPIGRPGNGRVATYLVPGPASKMTMPMIVYLPAAYFTPEGQSLDFPVIEALHGYPGTPEAWIKRLDIAGHLDREIAAGRMAPTVVLLPYQTTDRLLDTECTNLTGGPQAETYLTVDVPAWARSHLRIRTDRAAWGLTGYSAGAFCAMNLVLKHPNQYAAAASLSGFAGPGITIGDHSETTTNNIAWRLSHLAPPPVALWIGWADDDRSARNGSRSIVALAKPPITVATAKVPRGGHSGQVWKQMEGPAFDWLSAHLARPAPHNYPAPHIGPAPHTGPDGARHP